MNYTDMIFKWLPTYNKFGVEKDIEIEIDGEQIVIKKGLRTDFGSIPPIFKPFINPIGREVPAYVLHDYLCSESNKGRYDRKKADDLLYKCLLSLEVSKFKSFMIYVYCRIISYVRKFRNPYSNKQNQ